MREKCGYSVLKDKDFEVSRKVLNGKATDLQRFAMGKRPRKSDPLTEEEEVILWQTVLGKENPTSFFFPHQSTLWYERSPRTSSNQN